MILIDWTNTAQSVLQENWENWLQKHGYTIVLNEYVENIDENIEIQMFAANDTVSFAVYAPIDFGLIYINIPTPQDALMLIARLKKLLLVPWDLVQYEDSGYQQQTPSEPFLTVEGGTMQKEIDALKAQTLAQQMQDEEVIDQLTMRKLQKDTDIVLASLKQMVERNICPNISCRAITVLSQYQKIVDRLLTQSS
ncbi:hypothetical protein BZZ01_03885 [Nostocales cyanobacterium HT-58-2]|nr:hypothetical protein BZZ01_03885 [Nostocales cyanobacterium HT-58-2]